MPSFLPPSHPRALYRPPKTVLGPPRSSSRGVLGAKPRRCRSAPAAGWPSGSLGSRDGRAQRATAASSSRSGKKGAEAGQIALSKGQIHMVFTWFSPGVYMVFIWFYMTSHCLLVGFHVLSTWNSPETSHFEEPESFLRLFHQGPQVAEGAVSHHARQRGVSGTVEHRRRGTHGAAPQAHPGVAPAVAQVRDDGGKVVALEVAQTDVLALAHASDLGDEAWKRIEQDQFDGSDIIIDVVSLYNVSL